MAGEMSVGSADKEVLDGAGEVVHSSTNLIVGQGLPLAGENVTGFQEGFQNIFGSLLSSW